MESEKVEYYVPGEVICQIETDPVAGESWQDPLFENTGVFLKYLDRYGLLPQSGGADGLNVPIKLEGPFKGSVVQIRMPAASKTGKSSVLVKFQLKDKKPVTLGKYLLDAYKNQWWKRNSEEQTPLQFLTPNWFGGHAQTHISTGGPSDKPVALPQTLISVPDPCAFSAPELEAALAKEAPGHLWNDSIDVYVLDTFPDPHTLMNNIKNHGAFDQNPMGGIIETGLIPPAIPPVDVEEWTMPGGAGTVTMAEALQPGVFDELFVPPGKDHPKYSEPDRKAQAGEQAYTVSDHGLFIAGIIKKIAPSARILVIQVLDDYGIGTVESFAAAFDRIAQIRLAKKLNTPYLVNCSFAFDAPVINDLTTSEFARAHQIAKDENTIDIANVTITEDFQHRQADFFSALVQCVCADSSPETNCSERCLVTAAAGNDSHIISADPATDVIKVPRYPADIVGVQGVGAVKPDMQTIEDYSNESDSPLPDGIVTIGEVHSIYTQLFPDNAGFPTILNPDGFAVWSGTSFATAVVTGYVAKVCLKTGKMPQVALASVVKSSASRLPTTHEFILNVSQA